jgi:hypothetical protein
VRTTKPLLAFGSALKFVAFQQLRKVMGLHPGTSRAPSPYLATNPRTGVEKRIPHRARIFVFRWTRSNSLLPALRPQLSSKMKASALHFPAKGQPQYIALQECQLVIRSCGRPYTASRPLPWITPTELPNKWHLDTRRRPECNI